MLLLYYYIAFFYSIFLWNVAKSDFDSLADVSPQYTVKVFTNFGADDQSLVPGNPVTEEVSISNLGNYDAFVRLYLQSIFDVTYLDSVRNIALTQAAETTPTGTIFHEFVKRNDADTDWDSAPFEIGGATHLRVTYDPDGTAETGYRRFSRKLENEKQGGQTQGRNIEKQKLKLQRLYWKISNIRDNYIDQTIAEIVKTKPSFIAISDINVSWLMKNHYVAKYLLGQKLRRFRERLTSKCHETGIQLRIAEKSFRSASICSSCGLLNKGASISSDIFRCSCGYTEDRSLNASYNLRDMVIYTTG